MEYLIVREGLVDFKYLFFLLFFFFTSFAQAFEVDRFILNSCQVRETMEKMFAYHVENREFSPLVIRRSFKAYIEQFDPDHLYFVKEEVNDFLSLSDEAIDQIAQNYHQDRFPAYISLNELIQKSIFRNRQMREEIITGIIEQGQLILDQSLMEKRDEHACDLDELRSRMISFFIGEVKATLKGRRDIEPSAENIQRILRFRERKMALSEQSYLFQSKELDDHYLTLHILKAMSKSLDVHSGYYSPKEAYDIRASLKKEFSGIGVVLREEFDGIYIADVICGAPAHRSQKIGVGDSLIGLNDESIVGKDFDEILDMMKGKSGSKLKLHLMKKEKGVSEVVEVTREKIIMNDDRLALEIEPYGDGVIGKVSLPSFYDNGGDVSAEKDFREALRTLHANRKVYGLILDLRENAGGFLAQAVKVSALFIRGGVIVVSKYADGEVSYARDVDGRNYYSGPLVVLISKASASAAEIVSGALQDHGLGLIVGDERSYGKGSMQYQTLTDEKARSFFKVTVGRYYTASGRSPQLTGVSADIHVRTVFHPYDIGERYLAYPISGDQLTGEVFHSLNAVKGESFRDKPMSVIPYLSPYSSRWRQMLSQLRANSQKRLENDRNFQFFLKVAKKRCVKEEEIRTCRQVVASNFGVNDLQMKEAIEIIKDMFIISNR